MSYSYKSETRYFLLISGLEKSSAKIFDIGCSTGGKLAVLEKLGFDPKNLYGVDMSPMAIQESYSQKSQEKNLSF